MAGHELPPHDPETSAELHRHLYDHLQAAFTTVHPKRLAYDGMLWHVRAGKVRSPRNPSYQDVTLTLRQGARVPELFRADVEHPKIHPQYFEYSNLGGFTVVSYAPVEQVYMGQYLSMLDMVQHVQLDPALSEVQAHRISDDYYRFHPEEERHPMLISQQAGDILRYSFPEAA